MKRNKFKRLFFGLLTLGFAGMLVFSLSVLLPMILEQRESAQANEQLAQHINFAPPTQMGTQEGSGPPREPVEGESRNPIYDIPFPTVDFEALAEINPNVVGWLFLEGTPINYPVVHWRDNVRYLHHLFDGRRNAAGTLFVDSHNERGFGNKHTIIHGHHMRDGSMFAVLESYRSQEFFEENPYILLMTPERNYVIQVFAGYVASVFDNSWQTEFIGFTAFDEWIRESKERSDFTSNVAVDGRDRVITLSTCSYVFNDARFVLLGKLVPVG